MPIRGLIMAPKRASAATKGKGKVVPSQSKKRKTTKISVLPEPQSVSFDMTTELEWFKKFRVRKFIKNKFLQWGVLETLRLDTKVWELVSVGAWRRLFDIIEPTYRDLTAKFMVTFQFNIEGKDWPNALMHFQLLGMYHTFTVAEFSIFLGHYDRDFTEMNEFREMEIDMRSDTSVGHEFWQRISTSTQPYNAGCSKASTLRTTALRYFHAVLSHSITGRGNITGVVNKADLTYLWSMVQRTPIHLGYWLAYTIHHQCSDTRVGNIAIGPYVTRLTKGMGMIDLLDEVIYRDMEPVGFDMLLAMKMITCRSTMNGLQYSLVNAGPVEENVIPDQQPSTEMEQMRVDSTTSIKEKLAQMEKKMDWMTNLLLLLCDKAGIKVPSEPLDTIPEVPCETSNNASELPTEVDEGATMPEGAGNPNT